MLQRLIANPGNANLVSLFDRLETNHPLAGFAALKIINHLNTQKKLKEVRTCILKRNFDEINGMSGSWKDIGSLTTARLLYQAGAWDLAEKYYMQVGKDSLYYHRAFEELMWTRLQQGKIGQVKGMHQTAQSLPKLICLKLLSLELSPIFNDAISSRA